MSISLMKFIDEYVGRAIASFIIIFRNLFGRENNSTNNGVKNILLIKFWGIGSIVLTTPALPKIKKLYPDSKIYFLTLKSNQDICRQIYQVDHIVTIRLTNLFMFIFDFIKRIMFLRKITFDYIFDFEFYTYFSALAVFLIKSKMSIGFYNSNSKRGFLFSKSILFNDNIHTKDNFLNLINNVCKTTKENILPEITVNNFYVENREKYIVVNPNASRLAYERRLPKESTALIIDNISNNFKYKVIITGTQDEEKYVEEVYKLIKNRKYVHNLCGQTNIEELISLVRSSICLITVDSGPLHIASALNVPSIVFFGPESPQRYGPLSENSLVFYNKLKCSPCMSISNSKTVNCIFNSPRCMEQFNVQVVSKQIHDFISDIILVKNNSAA